MQRIVEPFSSCPTASIRFGREPWLIAAILLALLSANGSATASAPFATGSQSEHYQLVNSIFAAGCPSNMASANYRLQCSLSEPALPAAQTTISSLNYQHIPGFLAYLYNAKLFLPVLMKDFIAY